jgi:hypothetical protein
MYVFQHTGQLSIEEFYSPFGGKLDPNNRWVLLHKLIPWIQLESHYAPQFSAKTGAPAKPFQMAFGALYIQRTRIDRAKPRSYPVVGLALCRY